MRYFGGKAKIAKELSTFLQSQIKPNQTFVDLFCGSCNVVSKIQAKERLANDLHKELIALHIAVLFHLPEIKRKPKVFSMPNDVNLLFITAEKVE